MWADNQTKTIVFKCMESVIYSVLGPAQKFELKSYLTRKYFIAL